MISKPPIDLPQQAGRIPTVVIRKSDDLARSLTDAAVARPGNALGGKNSSQGYAIGKLIHYIAKSIIVILVYQDDFVVRKVLLSQRLRSRLSSFVRETVATINEKRGKEHLNLCGESGCGLRSLAARDRGKVTFLNWKSLRSGPTPVIFAAACSSRRTNPKYRTSTWRSRQNSRKALYSPSANRDN